jgi:hypothetical protein
MGRKRWKNKRTNKEDSGRCKDKGMKSRPRTKAFKKSNMGTESRNTYTM